MPTNFNIPEVVPGGVFPSLLDEDRWKNANDSITEITETIITIQANLIGSIGATFYGGGSALTAGSMVEIAVPFTCTIESVTLIADQTGSIVFDVKKAAYADYDTMTSIVASAPPTISAAKKATDTTLTGWTTAVTGGDVVRFSITSASTITRCNISLKVLKTS